MGVSIFSVSGQWVQQAFDLVPGWNAVYSHVDATHLELDELMNLDGNSPIDEIWLWRPPASSLQFINSPQQPTGSGSQWVSWERSLGPASDLDKFFPNEAYLVKVRDTAEGSDPVNYSWSVLGKPVPPAYHWNSDGQNLLGFPTVENNPPSYENFLLSSPDLSTLTDLEIFKYVGGDLGELNPARLFALRTTPVRRGEAVWLRNPGVYHRYFAPIEVSMGGGSELNFDNSTGQRAFRVKNLTDQTLTVTLNLVNSESAPAGEDPIITQPLPLLLRGELDAENLFYTYKDLAVASQALELEPSGQPGSEKNVVLGVNWSDLTGNPGDLYAGILRLTDSLGFSQIELPVSARVPSRAGLWIGEASIDHVRQNLKNFQRTAEGANAVDESGQFIQVGENTGFARTASPYKFRIILHNDGTATRLVQRVYNGIGIEQDEVLATQQGLLDPNELDSARRISSAQFPWSETNAPWQMTGVFSEDGVLNVTVDLAHDDHASNPFLHTFHPDHDNLDARFSQSLNTGQESYRIERQIQISAQEPDTGFAAVTSSSFTLQGQYSEVILIHGLGSEQSRYEMRGSFGLKKISPIPVLTTP